MQFLLLAPIVGLALANPAPYYKPAHTKCATVMGYQSGVPYHTSWTYHNTPCTVRKTRTITKTAGPGVRTSTRTITVTETSDAATITVPAADNFINVQTSLPDSEYSGASGDSPVERRGESLEARAMYYNKNKPLCPKNKKLYPKGVKCEKWLPKTKCKTITATKTRTIFHTPAATTVTRTRTTTVEADETTVYAACATSNFADSLNGVPLSNAEPVDMTDDYSVLQTSDTTAYDCCVAAQQDANGSIWGFSSQFGCAIAGFDTCPADQGQVFTAITDTDPDAVPVTLGNAGCGQIQPPQ